MKLQDELAFQKQCGVGAIAMEVSSHALDQDRVAGIPFHSAIFTNLSRDHLDYHGSMEAYAEAKAKLFSKKDLKLAVINTDDKFGLKLLEKLKGNTSIVACGKDSNTHIFADRFVRAKSIETKTSGLYLSFDSSWGAGDINTSLLGRFNAENILLTLAVLLSWEISLKVAISELENLNYVDGRMSQLGGGLKPMVVIDYAHTPDALENVLSTITDLRTGNETLTTVLGCGGDRDITKRPKMAAVATHWSNKVIFTSDNPRSESPEVIIGHMEAGVPSAEFKKFVSIIDRRQAIKTAVQMTRAGDLILIAGKGHENYQEIAGVRHNFDDFKIVCEYLNDQTK